jgi:hypothetical protein
MDPKHTAARKMADADRAAGAERKASERALAEENQRAARELNTRHFEALSPEKLAVATTAAVAFAAKIEAAERDAEADLAVSRAKRLRPKP